MEKKEAIDIFALYPKSLVKLQLRLLLITYIA